MPASTPDHPIDRIAVVIPARDEVATIGGCLTAIASALAPVASSVACHVTVVDDGSVDATGRIARRALADLGARTMVLRDPDSVEDADFGDAGAPDGPPPVGMVIAETEAEIRTVTVGRAVLELDMTGYPVVVFRNAAHGGLSVVYRRPDGNVGWIDPERTSKTLNGHGSVNGGAS